MSVPASSVPGSLAAREFIAAATVESTPYRPRPRAVTTTLFGYATEDGTFQWFVRDQDGVEVALGAAVATPANELASASIPMPLAGAGFVVFMRYTNTSGSAGIARFRAGDDAGA